MTYKREWFEFMGYTPHKGQSMLHFPKKKSSRFFVIVCGRGYGKTFASAKEASFMASMPDKNGNSPTPEQYEIPTYYPVYRGGIYHKPSYNTEAL